MLRVEVCKTGRRLCNEREKERGKGIEYRTDEQGTSNVEWIVYFDI